MEVVNTIEEKPKKKMKLWKKMLLAFIIIVLLVVTGAAIFISSMLNKINRIDPTEFETETAFSGEEFETDSNVSEDTLKPEDVTWPETSPSEESESADKENQDNVINILLIGQDRREGQGRQRSDSMMIASVNKRDKTVIITSLLRDSYVQIPGYKDNRINAAYAFGGMPLLNEVIKLNFGIEIDANVEVDFYGFMTIVDTLGGVDIVLKDYEAEYFNRITGTDKYVVGSNHLTGEEALMYARTRKVGRNDFERTERQRAVVTAAFNKLKNENPTKIFELINQLLPCIATDMSNTDIISYATLVLGMDLTEIQTYRIPADGTYSSQTIRGMKVLVPDLEACRSDLKKIIYGE